MGLTTTALAVAAPGRALTVLHQDAQGSPETRCWKRHSAAEIEEKLAKADALLAEGRRQWDVARILDISVMTYHRWRKARDRRRGVLPAKAGHGMRRAPHSARLQRIADLELENAHLRRLVTDLLLEKRTVGREASAGSDAGGQAPL